MTNTAANALATFIDSRANTGTDTTDIDALASAREGAEEFGLTVPDDMTGRLMSTLVASSAATAGTENKNDSAGAILITPAACVVGLYVLRTLPEKAALTCIDPEIEHQDQAKKAFRAAGHASSRARFLTSRATDVLARMAPESYRLVYVDADPLELDAVLTAAWPLLTPGGSLVLADALLDGTIADDTRKDRRTVAAREAMEHAERLAEDGGVVAHLPLGAGTTIITRR